jgi:hypothetical protein
LAENDPEAFGTSIVFEHDYEAEQLFEDEHQEEFTYTNYRGEESKGYRFKSPDPDNVNNYRHVRLSELYAADFVDEPAANPNGLFHRGPTVDVLTQAESVLSYVLGLSDQVPQETGGLSAERLKGFLNRFLDGRSMELSISQKEKDMKKETKLSESAETVNTPETNEAPETSQEKPVAASETQETAGAVEASAEASESLSKNDVKRFTEKFGAEKALSYLMAGTSFEDALSAEFDALKTKDSIVGSHERGEETPVGTFGEGSRKNGVLSKGVASFAKDVIRMPGHRASAN